MKRKPPKHPRKRPAHAKHTATFEDCTVTVRGNKVWMIGALADEFAGVARDAGVTFQEAFQACIRIGLPLVLAEHRIGKLVKKLKPASHKGARRVKKLRGRSIHR